ncbi:hypothetical protein D9611_013685 [Ephemerocybe angulata]|uniref:F-box domain-containing protein n=1 Tax=Ephemerocybe angulata TaxID=980116 RepID=A0A8H5B8U9_9AGAR|nr:hypothetical protein D9611_013685 [Tulosesus angulatus]
MTSPTLSGLPAELKSMVLSFCEAPALGSLSRTTRAFHEEAEQLLYGTISLHYRRPQSLACLKTLAFNKEKADLVRSLAVTLRNQSTYDEESDSDESSSEESEDQEAEPQDSNLAADASASRFQEARVQEGESVPASASDGDPVPASASHLQDGDPGSESDCESDDESMDDDDDTDTLISMFLDGACRNMGNIVFFSFKAKVEAMTDDMDDSVLRALKSLSGKPSLRTILIEPRFIPDPAGLPTWLSQYPNLEILGKWHMTQRDFLLGPPPPERSCEPTAPLVIGLKPDWDDKYSVVDSMRSFGVYIHDDVPSRIDRAFNSSNECRMPPRDHSTLGEALCKDLSLEAFSSAQSVNLFLDLKDLSAAALRGVQGAINGLLESRTVGCHDSDAALIIKLRETPKDITHVAWHELKLLFISFAAQGFRPLTIEIMALEARILTEREIKHGAQRLADVLNDPLLDVDWVIPIVYVRFLKMDLGTQGYLDDSRNRTRWAVPEVAGDL